VTKGSHFELDFYLNEADSFSFQPIESENLARMAFLHDCMDAAVRRTEGKTIYRYRDVTNLNNAGAVIEERMSSQITPNLAGPDGWPYRTYPMMDTKWQALPAITKKCQIPCAWFSFLALSRI
jgi:hypothetical protein